MPVSRRRRCARVAATAAAAVLTALAVAPTAPARAAARSSEGLFLAVSGSGGAWIRGVLLECPDTRHVHPHGTAACDALTWARGDLNALRGDPHACTKEYDPVTVTASGEWRGGPVEWHKTFATLCTMDAATGPVFRF
ncbi:MULTISPECIES: SSI family serine proteinase inhibitor [Streptomyces]|uniref:SSI family serine proteinase inhibitor n=1 Tax=Streptomyces TaxID=1883 RepID=UPI00069BEC3E|nr:SSI family serine proteinase inhibitor [Streptomyces sp. SID7805]MYU54718.1 protease inhibitor [Streptomyces sp. SID7805]